MKLEIGDKVAVRTKNLFTPFVLAQNEKGSSVEIPANVMGDVVEVDKNPKSVYSVGVLFTFYNALGEQKITLYVKPSSLCTMKQ